MRAAERLVGATALAAAMVALTAACSAPATAPAAKATTGAKAVSRPTAAPSQVGDDVDQAPGLPSPGKVLLQAVSRSNSEQFPEIARIPVGTAALHVVCTGPDKLTVDVPGIAAFTVDCHGTSPGQYDEAVLDHALSQVSVSVTGTPADHWALTLGWYATTAKPR